MGVHDPHHQNSRSINTENIIHRSYIPPIHHHQMHFNNQTNVAEYAGNVRSFH
jgi:hypothetical protein